jgi:hypothetical protein
MYIITCVLTKLYIVLINWPLVGTSVLQLSHDMLHSSIFFATQILLIYSLLHL